MVQFGRAALFGITGIPLAGRSFKKFTEDEYIKYGEIPDDEEKE